MAGTPKTIADLDPATALTGAELVHGMQIGKDVKVAIADLIAAVLASADPAGTATSALTSHLAAYTHGDIYHANRAALNLVSGTNTGDQNLSIYALRAGDTFTGNVAAPTFNSLTPAATATGFTIAGGTASKTLTVDETVSISNKVTKSYTAAGGIGTISNTGTIALTSSGTAYTTGRVNVSSTVSELVLNDTSNGAYNSSISAMSGVVRILSDKLNILTPSMGFPTEPYAYNAPGTMGDVKITAGYIYVCVATNTWKRATLSSW